MSEQHYCAFHILTGEYVYCHTANQKTVVHHSSYLLPPGANYDYDTPAVMLRHTCREAVYTRLRMELDNPSFHYKDRCMEEFEIHEFSEKLVPPHHRWKEYFIDSGQIKNEWER